MHRFLDPSLLLAHLGGDQRLHVSLGKRADCLGKLLILLHELSALAHAPADGCSSCGASRSCNRSYACPADCPHARIERGHFAPGEEKEEAWEYVNHNTQIGSVQSPHPTKLDESNSESHLYFPEVKTGRIYFP